ncbi:MAG: hypothetical protein LUG45_06870 [Clostridiales bacterium]|nr:hypothetical protein [Clostridiales bacterium]MCC8099878.1 hypothetical protein [Clostridiales bacterium]MCD7857603.1 hypothetical protein [Clostridiales bacterium]MCD7919787.1 hypothetical protein [Clostridiales bacterium]MCD8340695.1 hypothetical protein [Clostridiales bacterium]
MTKANFLRGMGLGVAVGAAIGIAMTPKRQRLLKHTHTGKTIRAVADVMDNLTDAMGL